MDVLGERWTLLIVRELIAGALRFTDLRDELHGIGSSLLSARLRDLEAAGIVQRTELPRPAARTVYQLTERGARSSPSSTSSRVGGCRISTCRPRCSRSRPGSCRTASAR